MHERVQIRRTNQPGTEQRLLRAALRLFRKKGFDRTTMRDIAREADMSLGAAYYYFRCKEELVHGYYHLSQQEHEAHVRAHMPSGQLDERLRFIMEAKLKQVDRDRRFLGALFRFAADPGHPLSVFAPETAAVRRQAQAIVEFALNDQVPDATVRNLLVKALWLAQLAIILSALHDSPDLARSRRMLATVATLATRTVQLLALPGATALARPLLEPLLALLAETEQPAVPTRTKRRVS